MYPAITHHEEKVRLKNQIVPMSVSSSYPSGAADRQDVQLRLTVRSSAEGKEPVCPALGEKLLWSAFKPIHEHQLTGRHETPRCLASPGPQVPPLFTPPLLQTHKYVLSFRTDSTAQRGGDSEGRGLNTLRITFFLSLVSCFGCTSTAGISFFGNTFTFSRSIPHFSRLMFVHLFTTLMSYDTNHHS